MAKNMNKISGTNPSTPPTPAINTEITRDFHDEKIPRDDFFQRIGGQQIGA
jgi:hypothetical protein